MTRNIGDIVEFCIIPGLWILGIIESFKRKTARYNIRFVRTNESDHLYYYCREEEIRDVQI